jgi:ATP-dependent DNA ligase
MLSLAVPKLPEGAEWQLELKLDGYRGIGIKSNGRAQSRLAPRHHLEQHHDFDDQESDKKHKQL